MEEAATPFPSEETTPPVTKIYFGAIHAARVRDFPVRRAYQPSQRMTYKQLSSECAWLSNRTIASRNSWRMLRTPNNCPRSSETFPRRTGFTIAERCHDSFAAWRCCPIRQIKRAVETVLHAALIKLVGIARSRNHARLALLGLIRGMPFEGGEG
jgi:hypothetical protein